MNTAEQAVRRSESHDTPAEMASQTPSTMRAVVYRRYGGPEQLSLTTVAVPAPQAEEVLIRIVASTVNRTDCGFLRAEPWIVRLFSGLFKPKAPILGCEFAGEVVEVGSSVDSFAIGDRVTGFKDDDYGFGGHAEYTTMPASAMLARIPDQIPHEVAAAALEGAHYALHYIRAARVIEGQAALVHGATGAIGSAAVQLLKYFGLHVVAVCAGKHAEKVSALGADRVIDYQREDFRDCGEQFNFVFDAVGKSSYFKCRHLLKQGGSFASSELGDYCQNPMLALWTKRVGRHRVLFPIPHNRQSDAQFLCRLMAEGRYTPLIDRRYALQDVADAFRYVETGMKTGNVVVEIESTGAA